MAAEKSGSAIMSDKGAFYHHRPREVNAFSVLNESCDLDQLGFLLAQQQQLISEAECERHDYTNNPGKGKGNASIKLRLLNMLLIVAC